jgi:4-amino-4-deoxy-L-arabinose transferase-like glycosyltransferase
VSARGYWLGLLALGGVYFALAAVVPAADDEFYYWCWSCDLRASYFDHPPLTAYLIRASVEVFGQSLWAIRLPACLASLVVFTVIASLTRPRTLLPFIVCTPLFTFGAVIVSPDVPLLLCWALYLAWQVTVHRRFTDRHTVPIWLWLVGGFILGSGLMGKYTAVLAIPAGLATFLIARQPWREWFPGYITHGLVALTVFLPVILFNLGKGFEPFLFQWRHAVQSSEPGGLTTLGEFVGLQVLIFGLLPIGLLPWVVTNRRELMADPRLRVCACFYAIPMAFFLVQSVRGPLEGNWALVCYLGVWPVAARWFDGLASPTRRVLLAAGAFAIPLGGVLLLTVHLIEPLPVIPPHHDRVTRQTVKVDLAARVAAELRQREPLPVYVPTYQWTALLRFHGVDARQLDGVSRPSHFTSRSESLSGSERSYLFSEGAFPPELTPEFGPPEIVRVYPLVVRGTTVATYYLLLYVKRGRESFPEKDSRPLFSVVDRGGRPSQDDR